MGDTQSHEVEDTYITAMSRPSVVAAYAGWNEVSEAERLCLERYVGIHDRVLDLGCGAGRISKHLVGKCGDYLGVDASSEMVATASAALPSLSFETADFLNFEFVDQSYDAILMMHNVIDTLHPYSRRQLALKSVRNWLSTGGVLIASSHLTKGEGGPGYVEEDYHGALVSNYRSRMDELIREVEEAGYEVRLAMRDYREASADWVYLVAGKLDQDAPNRP